MQRKLPDRCDKFLGGINMVTCTGCALLCEDVEIKDGKVLHACRKGSTLLTHHNEARAKPKVDGKEVSFEEAMKEAKKIVSEAENLAIYGLDTTTLEAQKLAVEIAEKKEAYIDDNSTFCLGDFVELILRGKLPTTTLDEVRDYAYVIFYWGTDPFHSLSRHMSKFTYYPRGKKRQRGYEEDRFLVVADIRKTHTAKLAKKNAKFIKVNDDLELVQAFIDAAEGKAPRVYQKDVPRIVKEMEKSDFNVIIGGLGLRYGLKGNYEKFIEMMEKLNERTKVYFIPAGCHPNMRGFNETLFEKVREVNKYSFREKRSSKDFAFYELLEKEKIDVAVVIGTDPVASLPFEYSKKLAKIKTIVIDPRENFTGKIASVVIPSAISGIETGGKMKRIDGVEVELEPLEQREINDVTILSEFLEVV